MKFKLIAKGREDCNAYGATHLSTGSVFEITDKHMIKKARSNPDVEEVKGSTSAKRK